MIQTPYKDKFEELKEEVRKAGLLDRVPVRGTIEMVAIIVSLLVVYATASMWNPFLLALVITIISTRSVFVSHDILHLQYFKNKKLSFRLSYPFSTIILSNSSAWWDFKHNINHHTYCNIIEKDQDIRALDGAFTNDNHRGENKFLAKYKHLVFWGALPFMSYSFIAQSYSFAIKRKLWGEFALMLLHWPIIWGTFLLLLPFTDVLILFLFHHFVLSIWLSLGFITNHLACPVLEENEAKEVSWMELQMRGSRSLSGNRLTHWFYGGLNTQIEHHLFPKAPRFNLLKVKEITQNFAKKNDIFYFETTPLEAYVQINEGLKAYK